MRTRRTSTRSAVLVPGALVAVGAALLPFATGCGSGTAAPGPDPTPTGLAVEVVAEGLSNPLHLTSPPDDPRLFVVEQPGRIRIIADGRLLEEPFLDLTDRVRSGGERGLLGLAFHPEYASNGRFFVNYTDENGDTRIEEYRVSQDPDRADPTAARLLLKVEQPFANHNGGLVVFGPDGMLYVGLGDGGGAGDPEGNGQDTDTLLGSLLRLEVDGAEPYTIPPDNPLADDPAGRPELWAWGLRNPWRFSFDAAEGMLYVADVGQNRYEEVNAVPAAAAGLDYGWNIMEGRHCFAEPDCDPTGLVLPVLEYEHPEGCSVTGGHVYRGGALPEVVGHYLYSDFCGGWLRSFRLEDGEAVERREWEVGDLGQVLSFGEDADRELYILSANGRVYRLVAGGADAS